jgi:hypothetical protein
MKMYRAAGRGGVDGMVAGDGGMEAFLNGLRWLEVPEGSGCGGQEKRGPK